KNATTYTYDDASQLTNAGGTGYSYDLNGNVTARGSDTFAWDHENRMTQSVVGGVTTIYAYNGDGLRVSQTSGGTTTSYVWDILASPPKIIQASTSSSTTSYLIGRSMIGWQIGSTWTYRLPDALGST